MTAQKLKHPHKHGAQVNGRQVDVVVCVAVASHDASLWSVSVHSLAGFCAVLLLAVLLLAVLLLMRCAACRVHVLTRAPKLVKPLAVTVIHRVWLFSKRSQRISSSPRIAPSMPRHCNKDSL
jgi:hypothetical protein